MNSKEGYLFYSILAYVVGLFCLSVGVGINDPASGYITFGSTLSISALVALGITASRG